MACKAACEDELPAAVYAREHSLRGVPRKGRNVGYGHTPDLAEDMTAFDVNLSNMESWHGFCPACGGNSNHM